jgi:hypothetical protein
MRDRLFEQDVTARLRCRDGNIQMHRSRIRYDDGIRLVLLQRIVQIGLDGIARQLVIRQGRFARAQQEDILFTQ